MWDDGLSNRVPTQIAFSNSLCFPGSFPVQPKMFPVPIYVIHNYCIHKTDKKSSFRCAVGTLITSREEDSVGCWMKT